MPRSWGRWPSSFHFAFPLVSGGNAYDFSRDLANVVYARPGGHAGLYLLRQQ
jgi:hypothetical protein